MAEGETGYGAARTSLRETLKWLVTVLTALGAAIAAGVTVSGLGGLSGYDLIAAAAGGAAAMICILIAITKLVRLLTVNPFYLGDLVDDETLKTEIQKRAPEVFPPGISTVDDLKSRYEKAIEDLAKDLKDPAKRENYASMNKLVNRVVDLAATLSLARDVRRNMKCIFVLALIAFGGLAWFGYVIGRAAAAKPAAVAAVLQPGAGWAEVAAALSKECGDGPFAVTLAAQTGLAKGWTATVTAPRCAGVAVTVPEGLVTVQKP